MSFIFAFFIMMFFLAIGDMVGAKTKAMIPSVFISASLFLIGFWNGWLPRDVMNIAAIGPMATLAMYLCIAHMGTLISVRELCSEWKTIVIAVCGLAGMSGALLYFGTQLIEYNAVVIGIPPLAGGLVATIMMGKAAEGLGVLALLAPAVFVVQGFVGYPLTAICLRIEGKKLLAGYRDGSIKAANKAAEGGAGQKRLLPPLPEKYQTTFYHLAGIAFIGWLAYMSNIYLGQFLKSMNPEWVKYNLHPLVICLIYGCLGAEIGIVEKGALTKGGTVGFCLAVIMALVMVMLNNSTPQDIIALLKPLAVIVVVGVAGMIVASAIVGKILGYSVPIAVALTLTALYGFPPNYILTEEAAKGLADTAEERAFLMDQMLPKMLVGGFTTVTVGSVIMAGFFVNMIVR
ncbi:MAG: hypothetical protein SOZ52_03525 [Pyramidobacter sp.]|nr:hypothetical protein [Pyramidobacter sp.]